MESAPRFNFAWDDCILGEIANNAYAIICLWGGGGGTRCIIGRRQAFEWLFTSVPKMANVERFDYNKVFYSLSLLLISFFTCRVDPEFSFSLPNLNHFQISLSH